MRRTVWGLSALLALVISLPGLAQTRQELNFGGKSRAYLVAAPPGPGPFPVVMLLHGGRGSARHVWGETQLPALAARDGFVLIAPEGVDRLWNDGRTVFTKMGAIPREDDIGFLKAVLARAVEAHKGDAQRLYAVGISNGGRMVERLACTGQAPLAAIAVFSASLMTHIAKTCADTPALPLLLVAGTKDPLQPYAGGIHLRAGEAQDDQLSPPDTAAFWAKRNRCGPSSEEIRWPDRVANDKTTVIETRWTDCPPGGSVRLLTVEGGGHAWPGGEKSRMIERWLGPVSEEFESGAAAWAFLKGQVRR
jgi:polyhydroxybutyrate depolymerase